jgi:hypothetical protein
MAFELEAKKNTNGRGLLRNNILISDFGIEIKPFEICFLDPKAAFHIEM